MKLTAPEVIIFDWDNTLVDTWPVIQRALNATLAFMGHAPWSAEQVRRDVKHSMRDSFPALFGDRWEIAAERYQMEYRAIHMEAIQPLPHAEETLKLLQEKHRYVCIVTNKRGPTLRKELDALGWNGYFHAHVGSQEAERDKPDAAPAIMALRDAPLKQGKGIWFIGDTDVDLECGARIGATPVLYGDAETQDHALNGHPFAARVEDHKALQAVFRSALA